jgi:hypothetical protein
LPSAQRKDWPKLQDFTAIPFILETYAGHADLAPVIAYSALVYFDDEGAEVAARKHIPAEILAAYGLGKLHRGNDPFAPITDIRARCTKPI